MNPTLVPVGSLARGAFFRKRTGSFPHVRISPDAVRALKLDEGFVYGVTPNGNTSKLKPETLVVPLTLADWNQWYVENAGWHQAMGCAPDADRTANDDAAREYLEQGDPDHDDA